jgi:hypothetical protein
MVSEPRTDWESSPSIVIYFNREGCNSHVPIIEAPLRRCLSLAGQVRSVDRPHTAVSADARLLEQSSMTNPGTYWQQDETGDPRSRVGTRQDNEGQAI